VRLRRIIIEFAKGVKIGTGARAPVMFIQKKAKTVFAMHLERRLRLEVERNCDSAEIK
jgi:hypothetical protein